MLILGNKYHEGFKCHCLSIISVSSHVCLFQCNEFGAYLNQSLKFSCLPELGNCLSTCTVSAAFPLGLTQSTRVQVHSQTRTHPAIKISFLLQEWCTQCNIRNSCAGDLTTSPIPTKIMQLHFVPSKSSTSLTSFVTWVSRVQNPLVILKRTV